MRGLKMLAGIILTASMLIISGCYLINDGASTQARLELAKAESEEGNNIAGFSRASGPTTLEFPTDFGPHPDYQTEWWYYTGNLETADRRHFGYQLTFFRRALLTPGERQTRSSEWAVDQVYMAHFALTDTAVGQHHAFERFARGSAGIAGAQAEPYQVWLQDWRVEEIEDNQYRLTARQDGLTLELIMIDQKGPILNGVQGYSQKGPDPGNASYYYSQTRLQTEGNIRVDDKLFLVSGLSWKDHEYSTSALSDGQVGWDWYSIQLDDLSELMVYRLRRADGTIDPYSSGTMIAADGSVRHLSRHDFELEVLDNWISPHTGAAYPVQWLLRLPAEAIELEITARLADQEVNLSYAYWEGAVSIHGSKDGHSVRGAGYMELSGYAGSMSGEF
jgi:predicted secreted hydrolase